MHICVQVAEVLHLDSEVLTEGNDHHCGADPGQQKDQDHAASASTIELIDLGVVAAITVDLHGDSA